MIEPELKSRLHSSWKSIQYMTTNPHCRSYQSARARGLTIRNQFRSFGHFCQYIVDNIGPPPAVTSKLCRKNQKKDYAPGNLIWADSHYIGRGYQHTIWVKYQGTQVILTDHARTMGLNPRTVLSRYWAGDRGARLFRPVTK